MREFMDKDFLLETDTARHLFHDYAAPQPLSDYHCHISPREIYENRRFNNLVEVWLGGKNPDGSYFGDHYKWRVMRSNGVPEDYVTGDKPAYERYLKFVEALQMAIGNPMYHWCNLELRQFFGFNKPLTPETAKEAWDFCNDKLQNDPSMTVRGIIEKANVAFIGTTDDPIDSLEWHEKIAADPTIKVKVCPSFRPDKAININKPGFAEYIGMLAASVGKKELKTVDEVCAALVERLEFFARLGCRASDHGLDYIPFRPAPAEEAQASFAKVMAGGEVSVEEAEKYQTAILMCLGRAYHRLNIAMQLHYSCYRNANERIYSKLGPDTGVDMIAQTTCGADIARFLSALDMTGECPKTILYSLNGVDNAGHHVRLLPVRRDPRQDPARLCLVVHGHQERHGKPDALACKPRPARQLCRHADRLPLLPELCPPRLLPPHPLQPHRRLGGKRRVSQQRRVPQTHRRGRELQERRALFRTLIFCKQQKTCAS